MINASRTGELRLFSGVRVRNAWAIYRRVGAIFPKGGLIPPTLGGRRTAEESSSGQFAAAPGAEPASYQLVGGVTASQGQDG